MVVGAGRGPLVRSAINASINTKRKIKILVIEKNPNAIITLSSLKEEMWSDIGLYPTINNALNRDYTNLINVLFCATFRFNNNSN